MSRVLKFRIRGNVTQRVCGYEMIFPADTDNKQYVWACSENNRDWTPGVHETLGLTREQFTGFLDKNGREIYEKDILQLQCGSADGVVSKAKITAEVVWNEDRFIALIPEKIVKVKGGSMNGKMVSWREMHTWVGMHTCLTQWTSKLEVIGDAYGCKV